MKTLFILLIFVLAAQVQAQTYYVAKTGNDLTGCAFAQNPATPRLTINAGLACVPTAPGAGANRVVDVGPGIYVESIDAARAAFPSGTSWAAPFTLRAKAGAIIANNGELNLRVFSDSPLYAIVSGFIFDGTNLLQESDQIVLGSCCNGANFLRFQNNELIGNARTHGILIGRFSHHSEILGNKIHSGGFVCTGGSGGNFCYPMYVQGSNLLIDGNELYDFPSYGIHGYSGYAELPNNNRITNNKIHDYGWGDSRANGVLVYNGNGNEVAFNSIWGAPVAPIATGPSATNALIHDNKSTAPAVVVPPAPAPTIAIDIKTTGNPQVTITVNGVKR